MAWTLTRYTDDQHIGRPRLIHLCCEHGLALFIFGSYLLHGRGKLQNYM